MRKRRERERSDTLERRMQLYRRRDWQAYRELIREEFEIEDNMRYMVFRQVISLLNTTMEAYQKAVQSQA